MLFELKRGKSTANSTLGNLYIEGMFTCYTLEDVVRPPGVKVQNRTAIPAGSYRLVIDISARWGKEMPHILDVPMFTGIRIHKGNTAEDTDGCILVGMEHRPDYVWNCQPAYDAVMGALQDARVRYEDVWIQII